MSLFEPSVKFLYQSITRVLLLGIAFQAQPVLAHKKWSPCMGALLALSPRHSLSGISREKTVNAFTSLRSFWQTHFQEKKWGYGPKTAQASHRSTRIGKKAASRRIKNLMNRFYEPSRSEDRDSREEIIVGESLVGIEVINRFMSEVKEGMADAKEVYSAYFLDRMKLRSFTIGFPVSLSVGGFWLGSYLSHEGSPYIGIIPLMVGMIAFFQVLPGNLEAVVRESISNIKLKTNIVKRLERQLKSKLKPGAWYFGSMDKKMYLPLVTHTWNSKSLAAENYLGIQQWLLEQQPFLSRFYRGPNKDEGGGFHIFNVSEEKSWVQLDYLLNVDSEGTPTLNFFLRFVKKRNRQSEKASKKVEEKSPALVPALVPVRIEGN